MLKEDRPLLGAVLVAVVVVAVEIPITAYTTDANWIDAWSNFGIPKRARRLINGKPTFESDAQVLPLQAADMLAWNLRREHEACQPPATLPMADLLRAERGHLMSAISDEMLRRWGEHHAQVPGIHLLQSKAQWQTFRRELSGLLAAGFIPPHGTRWKNFQARVRERLARRTRI